jgi:HEAT repeat protein
MALEDPAPEVRAEAAIAIAFLEGEIAVPLLVPLLKDPVDTVRSSVISALSYTNVQLNEKLAVKLMKNMEDKNPQIRDRCARALGRLKIKNAEKILLQCLGHDLSPLVRTGAAVGLGLFDNIKPDSLNTLRSLLKLETSSIVKNAIEETIACHFLPQND